MRLAEKHGRLVPEQYGSRRFHTSIDQVVNKRLTYDCIRQLRVDAALCSNDAKSCYDRITHPAAGLALRRAGTPIPAVRCMLGTIQELRHFIRSAHGTSVAFFDANDGSGLPISGIGQGNGSGPAVWAFMCCPLFEGMRTAGHGVIFVCPFSHSCFPFVGYAIVDDTDLCVTPAPGGPRSWPEWDAFEAMQASLTHWQGLLQASGGAIVPEKSHWYLIRFKWDAAGRWSYDSTTLLSIPDHPLGLQVADHTGVRQTVEQLGLNEGRRTVGVRLAPDGSNHQELEHAREIIATWTNRITTGRLPKHLVWLSLTTGILPKLLYALPATTFSQEDCRILNQALLKVALPHIQVNRHYPRALVHGPLSCLGLAIPDLYIEQGLQHIKRMVTFGHRPDNILGHLLLVSLEVLHLELGTTTSPFGSTALYPWFHLATDSWLRHTWFFCHSKAIQIRIPPRPGFLSTNRDGDRALMDIVITYGRPALPELEVFNRCRLCLRIFWESDLVSVDGRAIRLSCWEGRRCVRCASKIVSWPVQPRPDNASWAIWRRLLTTAFGLVYPSRRISRPLRQWQQHPSQWSWWVNHSANILLFRVDDSGRFGVMKRPTSRDPFQPSNEPPALLWHLRQYFPLRRCETLPPQGGHLRSEDVDPTTWIIDQLLPPFPPGEPMALFQCRQAREKMTWAFQMSYSPLTDAFLCAFTEGLETGTAFCVSDGSSKEGVSGTAWIAGVENSDLVVSGGFRVPGNPATQDSYRAELVGIVAGLSLVQTCCQVYHLPVAQVTFGSDSQSALDRAFGDVRPMSMSESHWDVAAILCRLLGTLPQLQATPRHIRGHQDADPMASLDVWAHRNILIDLRAAECRCAFDQPTAIPGLRMLWVPSTTPHGKVTSHTMSTLRDHCTAPACYNSF